METKIAIILTTGEHTDRFDLPPGGLAQLGADPQDQERLRRHNVVALVVRQQPQDSPEDPR